jgi:hypothetical protein
MPHRYTQDDEQRLAGVWLTPKLRRYCAWQFEPSTRTLKASRGVAVRTATLEAETRTLQELRNELPRMALALTHDNPPTTH